MRIFSFDRGCVIITVTRTTLDIDDDVRALLDVNVLIALLDANHCSHRAELCWLAANAAQGLASCPIAQNGCVRIMSHPGYPGTLAVSDIFGRLCC